MTAIATIVVTRYSFHHLLDPAAALREMTRVCAAKGRIVVVDAYAPEDADQAAEFNRIERLRDPSNVSSLSLRALKDLFARVGLSNPRIILYELQGEVRDLLARAFPNPGDEIEIVKKFRASAVDGRVGSPFISTATTSMLPIVQRFSPRAKPCNQRLGAKSIGTRYRCKVSRINQLI